METNTSEITEAEKLVELNNPDTLDLVVPAEPRPKRIRRITEPSIRPHKHGKLTYYTYCQGHGPEIYLGSATNILRAVQSYKIASGKKRA